MFGQFGTAAQIIMSILFFGLIIVYFRYSFFKMVGEMESVAETIEGYTKDAENIIVNTYGKGGTVNEIKNIIRKSFDFFLIPPVNLDPYGILKKLEHFLDLSEDKFKATAMKIAPGCDENTLATVTSLIKGGVGLNSMAKLVRHYVEFIKKTNNFQLAMVLQMNIPIIKKIATAQADGIKGIAEGKPIGDGIGSLVAASMMESPVQEVARDVVASFENIKGHDVIVVKAKGPGANLGKIGLGVEKLAEKNNIGKIITVDAALKMEGEPTGKVSEGIGAAIGDPGPEKARIEETSVKLGIPLEAIGIRVSIEEAIMPMIKEVYSALPEATRLIEEAIAETPEDKAVIIVGVGNTSGIGNSSAEVKDIPLEEKEKEEMKLSRIDKIAKWMADRSIKAEKEREKREKEEKQKKKESNKK
ncbi:hypothetical protein BMS3Bbin15_01798 [archaeon BMS3Bbin15]|nr:hypothetical protein BMS3Bbin15_01798 [archaeon BMS3Bbin15]